MRDNLRRVNVVLTKENIRIADELKEKYHGSRSQVLRQGLLELVEEEGNGGIEEIELRPIFEWMEEISETTGKMERRLDKLERGIDFLVGKQGSDVEKITDSIEELLLERREPMSVADMADYLPYSESEILCGVENGEDEFIFKRIEKKGKPPRWRIRGKPR